VPVTIPTGKLDRSVLFIEEKLQCLTTELPGSVLSRRT
jgi:hypothetical protein